MQEPDQKINVSGYFFVSLVLQMGHWKSLLDRIPRRILY